jgi:hypothetical protein
MMALENNWKSGSDLVSKSPPQNGFYLCFFITNVSSVMKKLTGSVCGQR